MVSRHDTTANRYSRRWLWLALTAIGLSALFAMLLVVARTPLLQQLFGGADLFHTVLVLHVNFSVLVWLLAFGALLWSLEKGGELPLLDSLAFLLAVVGAILISLSPLLTPPPQPVMSNYIPILHSPAFLSGLSIFGVGVGLYAMRRLYFSRDGSGAMAALLLLAALLLFVVTALRLPAPLDTAMRFESLFWGGGHLLQFVYLMLLLTCWQGLLHHVGVKLVLHRGLMPLVVVIMTAALLTGLLVEPGSDLSRSAYTWLMALGSPLLLALPLWRLWWHRRALPIEIVLSVALLLVGLLLGALIRSDNVTVTAHYHATNAAITIAFMGLTYRLLPQLGIGEVRAVWAARQLLLYFSGMVIYIGGMALSGWLDVPRKVALQAEGVQALSLGLMGLGGLVAISATTLFVLLLIQAARRTSPVILVKGEGHGTTS
ncbi:MAG: hypothetical protein OEZ16_01270 [Chromatiales bacterium]|nr:hypothetical protein [Chromatiales bacterium]